LRKGIKRQDGKTKIKRIWRERQKRGNWPDEKKGYSICALVEISGRKQIIAVWEDVKKGNKTLENPRNDNH